MAQRRIDSHHHFWYFNDAEYPWIGQRPALRRNFAPADLERELKAAGIDAAVSVQARQTVGETEWLLDFAEKHSFLAGVVGWAPLTNPGVGKILDGLARRKKLKGIRHGLQGESDNNYALRTDFQNGVKALLPHQLVYDLLILEKQLPASIQLVTNHPKQMFVLDHIAKPRIKEGVMSPWRENMREIAKRPNVVCKLSGIVTEADPKNWTLDQIKPYLDVALESFGPRRLMFGSDWPVALQATSYVKWVETVKGYISKLSPAEQDRIMGGTASETYRL